MSKKIDKKGTKPIPVSKKKDSHTEDKETNDELIPDEILDAIPEEDRGKVISIMKRTMFSGVMEKNNPIADKITEDHITKLIDNSDSHDKRDRHERKGLRTHNIILILIGLIFIVFLLIFLKDNQDLLIKIIIAIISFIGGFGYGKSSIRKES